MAGGISGAEAPTSSKDIFGVKFVVVLRVGRGQFAMQVW